MHNEPASDATESCPLGETPRTFISFLLLVHCFSVFVVLSANYAPSALQGRLVTLFAPYTRRLNFDPPDYTRFHLTHAAEEHDFHFIEVTAPESADQPLAVMPDKGWHGSERYQRYYRLAYALAFSANREFDSVSGEFAKAIGAHVMAANDVGRVVVRCRWHRAQPLERPGGGASPAVDPLDPSFYESVYEADVWIADDDSVQVLKKSSGREVAPAATDRAS